MDTKDIIKKIMDDSTPTEYPELYSRGDVEDAIRRALDMQTGKIKKQEQSEVDLEKHIEQTYHDGSVADTDDMDHVTYENIARYFFELGQRKAAEMYDEIEYNRQRAQEQEGQR